MPGNSAATKLPYEAFASDAEVIGHEALPPRGASPAGDLQHRVGEAALRGFYAPNRQYHAGFLRRAYVVVAGSLVSWGLVFGAGALLLQH